MSSKFSLDHLTLEAREKISQAEKFADDSKHAQCEPAHLLAILLLNSEFNTLLKELGADQLLLCSQLHGYLSEFGKSDKSSSLSPLMIDLIRRTREEVQEEDESFSMLSLLAALSEETQGMVPVLFKNFGLTTSKVRAALSAPKHKERDLNNCEFLLNLSEAVRSEPLHPIIGRENEQRRLMQVLCRQHRHHPIVLGMNGVGKDTIIRSLVERLDRGFVPKSMRQDTLFLQLNIPALLSGAKTRNDVDERVKHLSHLLQKRSVILYVRAVDTLLSPGLNLNLSDFFHTFFSMGNVRIIASCTPDGWKKIAEKDHNLPKEFTELLINEATVPEAIEVLRGVAARYEKHHKIKIGEREMGTAVRLAKRYVQNRHLPESAIDLVDEAASNKMMETAGLPIKLDKARGRIASLKAQLTGLHGDEDDLSVKARGILTKEIATISDLLSGVESGETEETEEEEETILTEESIALVLGEWTSIPVSKFLEGESEKLVKMEERLRKRVVGQDPALKAITQSVKRSKAGLRDEGKPIGSFLFLGSSGTGKTESAKALAEFLFDDETALTRIDMSEFQEGHMVARLIGAPVGYQGAEAGGFLTEAARKRPYSVILFDEVEKAHPDVFNVLLQVLDDGRLTDGLGRTADFSNTIIIMTSNTGTKNLLDADPKKFETEEGRAELKEMVGNEVKKFFRPEFINRIDEQVVFQPLTHEVLLGILDIQLNKLNQSLEPKDLKVSITAAAKKGLVDLSYEPAYGARPLKRAIAKYIQTPLSDTLTNGTYRKGSTVRVDYVSEDFVIES